MSGTVNPTDLDDVPEATDSVTLWSSHLALADRYVAHFATVRGVVRDEVTAGHIARHVCGSAGAALDIGAGPGHQALRLARRGFDVELVDPSNYMLAFARRAFAQEAPDVQQRAALTCRSAADFVRLAEPQSYDVVLCHGVLMYLDESRQLLRGLAGLLRPGGIISVLTKNAAALAFRPGMQGDYALALKSLTMESSDGWLGVRTRGDLVGDITDVLQECDVNAEHVYGVGVFSDHLSEDVLPESVDIQSLLALEMAVSGIDPYRGAARLAHVIGRRRDM